MAVPVDLDAELAALQLQHMTGMAMVITEQIQVIARHIDRAGVTGRPEANQVARHILAMTNGLGIGGAHQIHAGLGLAGE